MRFFQYSAHILPKITLIGQDLSTSPHRNVRRVSDDCVYYLITEGEIRFEEDGIPYHLTQGDCFLFEPGKLHFGTENTSYQLRYIHFRHPDLAQSELTEKEWLNKADRENKQWLTGADGVFPEDKITLPKQMHFSDPEIFSNFILMIDRVIERQRIHLEHYNTLCACAVQEIFIEIYRHFVFSSLQKFSRGVESAHLINKVLTYLNANYKRKLTGATIEKDLSYNFDYLNQLFRKHLDTSIFQMLETIRMEVAKNLIQTGGFSMQYIANEVGYKDEAYFSKVFKKHTDLSPIQYRKSIKNTRL